LALEILMRTVVTATLLAWLTLAASAGRAATAEPANFLFLDSEALAPHAALVERPDIAGVQIVYSWKSLEPAPDRYDFAQIDSDLAFVEKRGKKLFAQIQDRFFERRHRNLPRYLLEEAAYGGGLAPQKDNPGENLPAGSGWVAMQWNSAVRARYQKLLAALAARFDGKLFGVNLPETAADVERDKNGFSCDGYFVAAEENIAFARHAFRATHVVQYVNFWPCEWNDERKYMSRFFEFARAQRIGLGGPDIVPYRAAQMKNSYPFFNRYRGQLDLVAMAIQEPTLTYRNPATDKKFTRKEFVAFARDYLGVNIIFWSVDSPWLKTSN
jgi:hypothetical protein